MDSPRTGYAAVRNLIPLDTSTPTAGAVYVMGEMLLIGLIGKEPLAFFRATTLALLLQLWKAPRMTVAKLLLVPTKQPPDIQSCKVSSAA